MPPDEQHKSPAAASTGEPSTPPAARRSCSPNRRSRSPQTIQAEPPTPSLPGPSNPPLSPTNPTRPSPEMSIFTPLPSSARPPSRTDALGFPEPLAGPSTPTLEEAKGKARHRTPSPREGMARKRSAEEVITPPPASAPAVYPREPSPPARRAAHTADLLPLLTCPCCPSGSPLRAPTTLLCGHTVCSAHVTASPSSPPPAPRPGQPANLPTCPVTSCVRATSRVRSLQPSEGSSSQTRVTFYPTPRMDSFLNGGPQGTVIRVEHPRVDTSVASLMGVIERHAREEAAQGPGTGGEGERVRVFEDEEGSSEEDSPELEGGARDEELPSPRTVRPRKRPRRGTLRSAFDASARVGGGAAGGGAAAGEEDMTKLEKELMSELLCSMCYLLLYEPVTTPCQHTFCAKCLQRSLDHGTTCPLCREEMPGFSYHQDHPQNKLVLSLILTAFPEQYVERRLQLEQEGRNSRLNTPIFYPLLAFPGMPTMLHLFEPRYRLMLRRVIEDKTYRFGAIAQSRSHAEGMEYGTMMEIRSVQMFPDGRSMLETVGSWRFRIVERGYLDGYIVAKIERIDDYGEEVEMEVEKSAQPFTRPVPMVLGSGAGVGAGRGIPPSGLVTPLATPTSELPTPTVLSQTTLGDSDLPPQASSQSSTTSPEQEQEVLLAEVPNPTVDELMQKCHAFVDTLRSGSAPWVVQRLNTTYGDAPEDPAAYSFWIAPIMPIDEAEKAKLLPIRSTRLRLRLIVHWIEQLSNNWWFSNGCVIC